MIITLIVILILIVGITLVIIHDSSLRYNDSMLGVGLTLIIVGIVASLNVGIGIICNQVNKDICYQNTLCERGMLEYCIDNMEENVIGNKMIYNNIVEFNNELRSVKKWANSPWTNWFYNEKIATIDYIELDRK